MLYLNYSDVFIWLFAAITDYPST